MLGRLTRWLRISGYDTVSVSELEFDEEEDEFMLRNLRDRILLTKDRELYRKSVKEGRKAILIRSDSLEGQMRELMERGVKFQIVMDRCSLCNTPLRKPSRKSCPKTCSNLNSGTARSAESSTGWGDTGRT